jgi:hypothetical protein
MSAMSDGTQGPTPADSDGDGASVLQNLPRTRPQRASPRRAAARQSAARKTGAEGSKPRAPAANGGAREATPSAGTAGAAATGAPSAASAAPEAAPRTSSGRAGKRSPSPTSRRRRSTPKPEQVPPQGYESDDDAATGAVRPPGGAELALSAAEIVGELAKAGLTRSERLVKDVLARLPLS